jgi:hypothetical protein
MEQKKVLIKKIINFIIDNSSKLDISDNILLKAKHNTNNAIDNLTEQMLTWKYLLIYGKEAQKEIKETRNIGENCKGLIMFISSIGIPRSKIIIPSKPIVKDVSIEPKEMLRIAKDKNKPEVHLEQGTTYKQYQKQRELNEKIESQIEEEIKKVAESDMGEKLLDEEL